VSFVLEEAPETLRQRFAQLRSPQDVAALLDVKYSDLVYWIYRRPAFSRYQEFSIPKRGSGTRTIRAPARDVAILQRKLLQVLEAYYEPKPVVYGFISGRGHLRHAAEHLRKRLVFCTDIVDFFPSINFGRVRGMFMGIPYHLPERVATILAHLCCHAGELPQGAPTSPIVSNMICAQLASRLTQLAKRQRCTYSRYADDMAFSTNQRRFPSAVARFSEEGEVRPGSELISLVEGSGFQLNGSKTRLIGRDGRQMVTGIIVNERLNVPRRYRNQIRAMLHAWKKYGLEPAQKHYELRYSGTEYRRPGLEPPRFELVVKGKIDYLGQVRGKDDTAYKTLLRKYCECAEVPLPRTVFPMAGLLNQYLMLGRMADAQKRGYALEKLLCSLFALSGIDVRHPFRRNKGAEQIDGAFFLDGTHYLVECRWRAKVSDVAQADVLRGNCDRSSAHGLFLSISGWSDNVPSLLKQNTVKTIMLMNGEDLESVLREQIALADLLGGKLRALRFDAEPFASANEIIQQDKS